MATTYLLQCLNDDVDVCLEVESGSAVTAQMMGWKFAWYQT